MKITRIQVYGRTRSMRSRTRSIGFEADLCEDENIEAATMILQDKVDRALAHWSAALEAIDKEIDAEERVRRDDGP
jgi:hypothetical protein